MSVINEKIETVLSIESTTHIDLAKILRGVQKKNNGLLFCIANNDEVEE